MLCRALEAAAPLQALYTPPRLHGSAFRCSLRSHLCLHGVAAAQSTAVFGRHFRPRTNLHSAQAGRILLYQCRHAVPKGRGRRATELARRTAPSGPPPPLVRLKTPGGRHVNSSTCAGPLQAPGQNPMRRAAASASLRVAQCALQASTALSSCFWCREDEQTVHTDVDRLSYYLGRLERAAALPADEQVGSRGRFLSAQQRHCCDSQTAPTYPCRALCRRA